MKIEIKNTILKMLSDDAIITDLCDTDEEKAEQKKLREEYILDFRAGMRDILDNTYIQYPDGTRSKRRTIN